MRPRRLQLEGFSAFRSMPRPIDFDDVDLFALTGPTGSGKSTLLDAMCFALYGRVPRLPGNSVEPVISLGALEARVAFEFSLEDRILVAARVVRRTKSGATTPEARLEDVTAGDPTVLASGADDVTAAVEDLLGLSFEHFTKAVLLPQGAFAAFLHDKPAKRQDLLRTLLDLGVYEEMRSKAQELRARAEGEVAVLERQIEEMGSIDDADLKQARDRVRTLESALAALHTQRPELHEAREALVECDRLIAANGAEMALLAEVDVPEGVSALASRVEEARAALETAGDGVRRASIVVSNAMSALEGCRSEAELAAMSARWKQCSELVDRIQRGTEMTVEAEKAAAETHHALEAAVVELETARAAVEEMARRHSAHILAKTVEAGDDCPVCGRVLETAPHPPEAPGLDAAVDSATVAEAAVEHARQAAASADATHAAYRSNLQELRTRLDELTVEMTGDLDQAEFVAEIDRRTRLATELDEARSQDSAARSEAERCRVALDEAERGAATWRRSFLTIRDRVASMGPPEADIDRLESAWTALSDWATEAQSDRRRTRTDLEERRSLAAADVRRIEEKVSATLTGVGLDPGGGEPVDMVVMAVRDAATALDRLDQARTRLTTLVTDVEARRSEGAVARSMATHLSARGFEGWLMEEALVALVDGANRLLDQLSGSAYSLQVDRRDFTIVDHRNADEERTVKTLSGGETFLVSLALSLSLAEQIGSLGVFGAGRLESIFLDEGFGTLDAETLDTVAAVIGELGASGRVVGIVTHVKELAELVPTRFEVVKQPSGSSVRRVDT